MKVKKILVSQAKPASDKSPYFDIADKFGADVVFRPFIKVEGLSAREFRAQKLSLADFTAVIFTAKIAVDNYFRLAEETRFSVPDTMKYFCTNKNIADYLQKYIVYRKRKIFKAETGHLADLIPFMLKHKTDKYLYAVSETDLNDESAVLDANKIDYTRGALYRTVSNDFGPDEPFDYDMLVFFSPHGIESLVMNFPDFDQKDIVVAVFGNNTANAAREAGLRVDIEVPTPQMPSMTGAIDKFLEKTNA